MFLWLQVKNSVGLKCLLIDTETGHTSNIFHCLMLAIWLKIGGLNE